VSGAGADRVAQGLNSGAEPGPGLPRRRLLLAGAGLLSTAGLGAVVWEASRLDAAQPRTTVMREPPARRLAATQPSATATPGPPARRAAIWQAKVSVPRPQVMAAAGGLVCVAGDEGVYFNQGTARDMVQALNARDGSHMWTFTVRTGVRGMGFANPPGLAAGQGYVYVAVDRLYCLRAGDGAQMWTDPYPLTLNLAAGPDAVYAVQATLFALSSRDGTRLWSFAANAGAMPAPLLADGIIYVLGYGTQSNVVAIRASDGARLWDSPGPGGGWLACDGKTVCAVSGVGPGVQIQGNAGPLPTQMWTYRASDGKLLYRSAANAGYSSPLAMTAGMVFTLTAGNGHTPSTLRAVDPVNGRTVWSYPGASAAPAAAPGRIYTASPDGNLIALNASDGTPVWQCPIRFTLGPLVAGSTVYVCDNTTVYAVRT
jgi:outer membrane protein assembly factor BamB